MSAEPRGDGGHRLVVEDLGKRFAVGGSELIILDGASFTLAGGEAIAILGPSGSGKSTLLHILGTLDTPTAGRMSLDGEDPFALPEPELARFRNRRVGFVFQDHHLLPQYTVLENVLLPTLAFADAPAHSPAETAEERARRLLDRVGLSARLAHRPAELSGGERQRVAVARALIGRPALLLCDEPTGNLDRATAATVADLLFELHREEDNLLVVVTHSLEIAARFGRRLELVAGRCVEA